MGSAVPARNELLSIKAPSENLTFILPQSPWPPQEIPPSIGPWTGILSSWPAQEPLFVYVQAPLRKLYLILLQSPWPPQEIPPSIGSRNGILSSWPELLATRPEWKLYFLFLSIISFAKWESCVERNKMFKITSFNHQSQMAANLQKWTFESS